MVGRKVCRIAIPDAAHVRDCLGPLQCEVYAEVEWSSDGKSFGIQPLADSGAFLLMALLNLKLERV